MAYDIAMCEGESCPLKVDCYRYTSEILGRQDFLSGTPYNKHTHTCDLFMTNECQVRRLAYILWERDGKKDGNDKLHWEQAKEYLKNKEYGKADKI